MTVTAKDGKSRKLLIGDDTPTGTRRVSPSSPTMPKSSPSKRNKRNTRQSSQDLRDKRLLVFDTDKLTRVELAAKGTARRIRTKCAEEWQIVKPKPQRADNGQVEDWSANSATPRMDTVTPDDAGRKAAAAFASDTRVGTATVTDNAGPQTLDVRKKGNDYYAKSSAVQGVFKVGSGSRRSSEQRARRLP